MDKSLQTAVHQQSAQLQEGEDFPHLNKDTKVVDLTADKMGILVGLLPTSEEYPIPYDPMIRAVHI
jgi:hypothetical protein